MKFIVILVIEDAYIIAAGGYTEMQLNLEIVIMLFEKEKLSMRKAAAMANLHWLDFMKELDEREIALHYDESLL